MVVVAVGAGVGVGGGGGVRGVCWCLLALVFSRIAHGHTAVSQSVSPRPHHRRQSVSQSVIPRLARTPFLCVRTHLSSLLGEENSSLDALFFPYRSWCVYS